MGEEHPHFEAALTAMDRGDVPRLAALLESHPELAVARAMSDEAPYDGYFWRATLLHHVAGNPIRGELPDNAVEIARLLIDAGADVEATCGGGPTQPESAGGTTLGLLVSGAQACLQGLTEPLLDCLIEAGAQPDPTGTGGGMWIALYHTVENRGQRDVAEMLFDRGHPVDLCFAAGLGEREIVESYLRQDGTLAPGADRLYRHHRRSEKEATDQEVLQDALLFACVNGRRDVAQLLLDRGADVNAVRSWAGEFPTPLHGAAWAGWVDVARLLVEHGAEVKVRDQNHGSTPIGWAAHSHRHDVLEYLVEDPDHVDLLDALELGRADLFDVVLGDGDPDQDLGPGGPGVLLRAAVYQGNLDLVVLLLERGADPALSNPAGKTALDWAVEGGHDEIAEILRQRIRRDSSAN